MCVENFDGGRHRVKLHINIFCNDFDELVSNSDVFRLLFAVQGRVVVVNQKFRPIEDKVNIPL